MKGKTALVTGANGGIGSALIKLLEKKGVRCIAVDNAGTFSKNPSTKSEFIECDFTDQTKLSQLINNLNSRLDKLDYIFNVAGIGIYKNLEELNPHEWNNSIAINLTAPFLIAKGFLPLLKKSEKATIFNIGSGMGVMPTEGRVAYCSSKFGLRGLSLTLSKELKNKNISVVHLNLGSVMTNFGTGGLSQRKELAKKGKKYLAVSQVINQIVSIMNSPLPQPEYILYPEGYN